MPSSVTGRPSVTCTIPSTLLSVMSPTRTLSSFTR